MTAKKCPNGHLFEKSSSCPVCPICSKNEMKEKFNVEFPDIGTPAFRALDNAGITQLSQLTKYTESQLLNLHGIGPKAIKLLKEKLKARGQFLLKNKI